MKIDKLATDNLTVAVFETHSNKNDIKSREAGRPIYDDMIVCKLRFAANKQTVGVFPAHEIFRWIEDKVTGEREPLTYALAFPDQYRAFMAGEAQVASGTPISELPFITQGKRLELKAVNILTAEALAAVDGGALKMLGAGGRALKEQTQAYLDSAAGTADVSKMAAENADLRERLAALEAKIGLGPAYAAPAASAGIQADQSSPFFIMEAEDIRNWIKEASGKEAPENLAHAALVKLADEVNAAIAAEKAGGARLTKSIEESGDEELRAFIKAASGKAPPHNAGRAALESRAAELVDKAAA